MKEQTLGEKFSIKVIIREFSKELRKYQPYINLTLYIK